MPKRLIKNEREGHICVYIFTHHSLYQNEVNHLKPFNL